MKISAIIPHYPIEGADKLLRRCVDSLDADEVIVVVNDGIGFAKAVNIGLKLATGTHLCVINNDTEMIEGSLRSLCLSYAVCTPTIVPPPKDTKPRAFFCMPARVFYEVGEYDERFEGGYFEDDDYIRRLEDRGISMVTSEDVLVEHRNGGGFTMKAIGEQEHFDINRKKFEDKWGV